MPTSFRPCRLLLPALLAAPARATYWPEDWTEEDRWAFWGCILAATILIWSLVVCGYCYLRQRVWGPASGKIASPASKSDGRRVQDRCGKYMIRADGVTVKEGASLKSKSMGRLSEGNTVDVVEMWELPREKRIRAKIPLEQGYGWISIRSQDGNLVWASKEEGKTLDLSEHYPRYWENCPQSSNQVKTLDFEEIYTTLQDDVTAIQDIFDSWAYKASVSKPDRIRIVRVERNENSRIWKRYVDAKERMVAQSTAQSSRFVSHSVKDYSVELPMTQLDGGLNETYLFYKCDFAELKQVCADGFPQTNLLTLAETPYTDNCRVRAVQAAGIPSCDSVLMGPMFTACGGEIEQNWQFLIMFRAAVGRSPLQWAGPAGSLLSVLQRQHTGMAVSEGGGLRDQRFFYTVNKDLVYPEYVIYFQSGGSPHEMAL